MKFCTISEIVLINSIRLLLATALLTASLVHAGVPAVPEIPPTLPDSFRQPLIVKRQPLALRKLALVDEGTAINSACAKVEKGSSQHQNCLARLANFNTRADALSDEMDRLADEIDAAVRRHTIHSMNALARRLGWAADELARLDTALNSLAIDGDPNVTDIQIRQTWQLVQARGYDAALAAKASQGEGPGIPGAGTQTRYEDCTIFALANATGLPYAVAAARAAKLIGEATWRDAAGSAQPQKTIEQHGLTGGEVVMLTEAFGQVEVVRSADFAKSLKAGSPVMVNVVPASGNVNSGHQVVLTKMFVHEGANWYEMMDSNQGPLRRLYLSSKELSTMLQENGVAFHRDPGTTPMLLR